MRIRGTVVQTSHCQAFCYTGAMHSTGSRHRGQNTELDCEMGQTLYMDQDVNVI